MARPIKETPILYGEDARRFEARMQERRRISPEERARINAAYEAVKRSVTSCKYEFRRVQTIICRP